MTQLSCSACEDLLAQQRVESLSPGETDTIADHLQICAVCSAYAQALERLSSALNNDPLPAPQVHAQVHAQVRAQIHARVHARVRARVRAQIRTRLPSPASNLLQTRVPLYQVALGAAAVLLLFVVDAPAPQRGADTQLSPSAAVTAAADTYEVSANLRLLNTTRRGLGHGEDSLMIHFPTSVSSI